MRKLRGPYRLVLVLWTAERSLAREPTDATGPQTWRKQQEMRHGCSWTSS